MPKVSVIVPVYKAEKYINRCIDSILAQTFTDWELLLIDDGSPDRSGEICDEYAENDPRIRVFHKANGGVSSARQMGQEEAVGEYTIHADPDDWVEPTMLEELYAKAVADDADMVICDFFLDTKSGGVICKQEPRQCTAQGVFEQLMFQQLHGSCWNKLVRRVCYTRYDVKFPKEIIRWEDLYVNCCLLMHPMKISYLNKAFYHYDQIINPNSIVRNPSMAGLKSQIYFIDHFKSVGISDEMLIKAIFATKELAYTSGVITAQELIDLYRDLNDRYVSERPTNVLSLSAGLKALLKGHKVQAYILRKLLLIVYWIRKHVKG